MSSHFGARANRIILFGNREQGGWLCWWKFCGPVRIWLTTISMMSNLRLCHNLTPNSFDDEVLCWNHIERKVEERLADWSNYVNITDGRGVSIPVLSSERACWMIIQFKSATDDSVYLRIIYSEWMGEEWRFSRSMEVSRLSKNST